MGASSVGWDPGANFSVATAQSKGFLETDFTGTTLSATIRVNSAWSNRFLMVETWTYVHNGTIHPVVTNAVWSVGTSVQTLTLLETTPIIDSLGQTVDYGISWGDGKQLSHTHYLFSPVGGTGTGLEGTLTVDISSAANYFRILGSCWKNISQTVPTYNYTAVSASVDSNTTYSITMTSLAEDSVVPMVSRAFFVKGGTANVAYTSTNAVLIQDYEPVDMGFSWSGQGASWGNVETQSLFNGWSTGTLNATYTNQSSCQQFLFGIELRSEDYGNIPVTFYSRSVGTADIPVTFYDNTGDDPISFYSRPGF